MTTEFLATLAYLSSAIKKPIPADQAEVYWDLLGDLPAAVLATAAKQVILESEYPVLPTVGALRKRALALMQPAMPQWSEAWELVLSAVNRYGYANQARALATLPDLAARTARALGWQSLCDASVEQLPTVRAQFRDAYSLMAAREQQQALPPARYQRQAAGILGSVAERFQIENKP